MSAADRQKVNLSIRVTSDEYWIVPLYHRPIIINFSPDKPLISNEKLRYCIFSQLKKYCVAHKNCLNETLVIETIF